jgi:hypothetical protein
MISAPSWSRAKAGSRKTWTLSFDLARALRWVKPQRAAIIKRRERSQLPYVSMPASAGSELLIDTCVYIDVLQGRARRR